MAEGNLLLQYLGFSRLNSKCLTAPNHHHQKKNKTQQLVIGL